MFRGLPASWSPAPWLWHCKRELASSHSASSLSRTYCGLPGVPDRPSECAGRGLPPQRVQSRTADELLQDLSGSALAAGSESVWGAQAQGTVPLPRHTRHDGTGPHGGGSLASSLAGVCAGAHVCRCMAACGLPCRTAMPCVAWTAARLWHGCAAASSGQPGLFSTDRARAANLACRRGAEQSTAMTEILAQAPEAAAPLAKQPLDAAAERPDQELQQPDQTQADAAGDPQKAADGAPGVAAATPSTAEDPVPAVVAPAAPASAAATDAVPAAQQDQPASTGDAAATNGSAAAAPVAAPTPAEESAARAAAQALTFSWVGACTVEGPQQYYNAFSFCDNLYQVRTHLAPRAGAPTACKMPADPPSRRKCRMHARLPPATHPCGRAAPTQFNCRSATLCTSSPRTPRRPCTWRASSTRTRTPWPRAATACASRWVLCVCMQLGV